MIGMGPVLTPPKKRPKLSRESDSFVQAVDALARQRALSQMHAGSMESELSDLLPADLAGGVKPTAKPVAPTAASTGDHALPVPASPQPTPVTPTPVSETPSTPGVMSIKEWGKANHPHLARMPVITRQMRDDLLEQYDRYVGVQQAVAQMGHAQTREARFGRESAARMEHADTREGRLERESAARLSPTYPGHVPSTLPGQMGYALLTGLPEETQKRLFALSERIYGREEAAKMKTGAAQMAELQREAAEELLANDGRPGPKYRVWQRMKIPSLGVMPRGGKELRERMFGPPGLPSFGLLSAKIDKEPVVGWLEALREITRLARTYGPEDRVMMAGLLRETMPTVEQVITAARKRDITPDEKQQILSILEAAQKQEQAR